MLTRKWKEEWRKMHPEMDCDWKVAVSRYVQHFGSDAQVSSDSAGTLMDKSAIGDDEGDDDKVKGFRKWTARTKMDLLETHRTVMRMRPELEPGSSEFNKLLLHEFQKLHPKCMESSRSIYSKVQSIEKEEQQSATKTPQQLVGQQQLVSNNSFKTRAVTPSNEDFFDMHVRENGEVGAGVTVVKKEEAAEEEKAEAVPFRAGSLDEKENEKSDANELADSPIPGSLLVSANADEKPKPSVTPNLAASSSRSSNSTAAFPSSVNGFEDWSLTMIRDFIACMDSTRRKFATLKEKDPDGSVKLVPLLLDEWKTLYPDTTETVKTFLVKIKHLKQQKDLIKKHLCQAGLLPRMENNSTATSSAGSDEGHKPGKSRSKSSGHAEFRWHKSMIDDVINSRKRALDLKEQGMRRGKKLSFHSLWADEFKKLHPNSTFTSNNLSVHLWTWRKQQQRMGKQDPLYDEAYSLADTTRPLPASNGGGPATWSGPNWNAKLKSELLVLGKKVQASLSDSTTPNEQKVLGFSNLLHEEWCKTHPRRNDTVRALNSMYSRIVKEGVAELTEEQLYGQKKSRSLWTPKHNQVLRECMEKQDALTPVSYSVYRQKVIEEWRQKFPTSDESTERLRQRIADLTSNHSRPPAAAESSKSMPINLKHPSNDSSLQKSSCLVREPNSRGQMCWNNQTIRDLFHCHQVGLSKRQTNMASATCKKETPLLSTLVHREFLKLHPYCRLTPAILMAKLYCWKNALNKGTLDLDMTESPRLLQKISTEKVAPKIDPVDPKPPVSKDIIFRTWSQEMMDNLIKTRRLALSKKQRLLEQGRHDVQLLDIWYDEFLQLHPEYKSTKKNLMQKYKWYRSRVKKLGCTEERKEATAKAKKQVTEKIQQKQQQQGAALNQKDSTDQTSNVIQQLRVKHVRKDVFLHIKALMEESRIFLPMKLPQEPELKPGAQLAVTSQHQQLSTSSNFILTPATSQVVSPAEDRRSIESTTTTPSSGLVATANMSIPSASRTLAHLHHKAVLHQQHQDEEQPSASRRDQVEASSSAAMQIVGKLNPTEMPLNLSLPAHIKPATDNTLQSPTAEESEQDKKDAIKLPGGATLVAVTDRNAEALLKPKPVEKPHVTITIGEKVNKSPATTNSADFNSQNVLSVSTSRLQPSPPVTLGAVSTKQPPIVLSIPKVPVRTTNLSSPVTSVPLLGSDQSQGAQKFAIIPASQGKGDLVQQPLHHQQQLLQVLPSFTFTPKAIFIPSRVKARLEECGMTDLQFIQLLTVYERARNEYIDTLKRGYLAFFPFILGSHWRHTLPQNSTFVAGRKLAAVVDLYVEEKNKGRVVTPEYLTKKPCMFEVTEQLLRQVLVLRAEVARELEESGGGAGNREANSAIVNAELCRRWQTSFPEMRMTAKQLISIHEMLTYDHSKSSATPEVECTLADVWKLMEKGHKQQANSTKENLEEKSSKRVENFYDENTLTIDQMQEWLLETQSLPRRVNRSAMRRPRLVTKNMARFWTRKMMADLEDCRLVAIARKRFCKRPSSPSLSHLIFSEWMRLYPNKTMTKWQVLSKCARLIRQEKRQCHLKSEKIFDEWRRNCEEFTASEDLNQVIVEDGDVGGAEYDEERNLLDEETPVTGRADLDDGDPVFSGRLTSLSKISSLQIASNVQRNFHNDEDVLSYIGEVQRLGGRGSHPISWTPDVIRDLMTARKNARRRKREWEVWATKEYGGVGFAYMNPDVKNVKVDDMFKEEWAKLRPDMASLSIWTLVSYARKYDNLKRQLIMDNNQRDNAQGGTSFKNSDAMETPPEKKLIQSTVFFKDSGIPKFDLDELSRLPDVSTEFRDLLLSRQRAKIRQETSGSRMSLLHLWQEEWSNIHPQSARRVNGHELQRRLWLLERSPGNLERVKSALLRAAVTEKAHPIPVEDEVPRVVPRHRVFVEDANGELYRDDYSGDFSVTVRASVQCAKKRTKCSRLLSFAKDVFNMNRLKLIVPAVEKGEEEIYWEDDEEDEGGEMRLHQAKTLFDAKPALKAVTSRISEFWNYGQGG